MGRFLEEGIGASETPCNPEYKHIHAIAISIEHPKTHQHTLEKEGANEQTHAYWGEGGIAPEL